MAIRFHIRLTARTLFILLVLATFTGVSIAGPVLDGCGADCRHHQATVAPCCDDMEAMAEPASPCCPPVETEDCESVGCFSLDDPNRQSDGVLPATVDLQLGLAAMSYMTLAGPGLLLDPDPITHPPPLARGAPLFIVHCAFLN